MLCLCTAAFGAPLRLPTENSVSAQIAGFAKAVDKYTFAAYVDTDPPLVFSADEEFDGFAIATTLNPPEVERVDKATTAIGSSASLLAPEPPTMIMVGAGFALILAYRLRRPAHRAGRRRARTDERSMARI